MTRFLSRSGAIATVLFLCLACHGGYAANLNKRELVVFFSSTATDAQIAAVRTACSHVSHTRLERSGVDARNERALWYRIDRASIGDEAQLAQCLQGRPGVVGFDEPELTQ